MQTRTFTLTFLGFFEVLGYFWWVRFLAIFRIAYLPFGLEIATIPVTRVILGALNLLGWVAFLDLPQLYCDLA